MCRGAWLPRSILAELPVTERLVGYQLWRRGHVLVPYPGGSGRISLSVISNMMSLTGGADALPLAHSGNPEEYSTFTCSRARSRSNIHGPFRFSGGTTHSIAPNSQIRRKSS